MISVYLMNENKNLGLCVHLSEAYKVSFQYIAVHIQYRIYRDILKTAIWPWGSNTVDSRLRKYCIPITKRDTPVRSTT